MMSIPNDHFDVTNGLVLVVALTTTLLFPTVAFPSLGGHIYHMNISSLTSPVPFCFSDPSQHLASDDLVMQNNDPTDNYVKKFVQENE